MYSLYCLCGPVPSLRVWFSVQFGGGGGWGGGGWGDVLFILPIRACALLKGMVFGPIWSGKRVYILLKKSAKRCGFLK